MKPAALIFAKVAPRLSVRYDGHTVELPARDGVGLVTLYRRWQAAGKGATFEVRDATTNLVIAIGARSRALKSV